MLRSFFSGSKKKNKKVKIPKSPSWIDMEQGENEQQDLEAKDDMEIGVENDMDMEIKPTEEISNSLQNGTSFPELENVFGTHSMVDLDLDFGNNGESDAFLELDHNPGESILDSIDRQLGSVTASIEKELELVLNGIDLDPEKYEIIDDVEPKQDDGTHEDVEAPEDIVVPDHDSMKGSEALSVKPLDEYKQEIQEENKPAIIKDDLKPPIYPQDKPKKSSLKRKKSKGNSFKERPRSLVEELEEKFQSDRRKDGSLDSNENNDEENEDCIETTKGGKATGSDLETAKGKGQEKAADRNQRSDSPGFENRQGAWGGIPEYTQAPNGYGDNPPCNEGYQDFYQYETPFISDYDYPNGYDYSKARNGQDVRLLHQYTVPNQAQLDPYMREGYQRNECEDSDVATTVSQDTVIEKSAPFRDSKRSLKTWNHDNFQDQNYDWNKSHPENVYAVPMKVKNRHNSSSNGSEKSDPQNDHYREIQDHKGSNSNGHSGKMAEDDEDEQHSSENSKIDTMGSNGKLKVTFNDDHDVCDIKTIPEKTIKIDYDTEDYISVSSEGSELDIEPKQMKKRRTFVIFLSWIFLGVCLEIPQPLFPFLQSCVNRNYEETSRSFAGRGAGVFLGSLIGGALYQGLALYKDLWMALALLIIAGTTAAIPFLSQLLYQAISFSVQGFGIGICLVGSMSNVISLYQDEIAANVFHALFIVLALGITSVPFLCRILLGSWEHARLYRVGTRQTYQHLMNGSSTHSSTVIGNGSVSAIVPSAESTLPVETHPFVAVGIAFLFLALLNMLLFTTQISRLKHWCPTRKERQFNCERFKPSFYFQGHTFSLRSILYLFVMLIFPAGNLYAFSTYLYEMPKYHSHINGDDVAFFITIFWVAVTLSRGLAVIVRKCLAPNGILMSCFTFNVASGALLMAYGNRFPSLLWGFTAVIGAVVSPLLPAAFTWTNIYINMTPMGLAVGISSYGLGLGGFAWLTGFLLQTYGHKSLLYLSVSIAAASFLLYTPLIPVLAKRKLKFSMYDRYEKKKPAKSEYV